MRRSSCTLMMLLLACLSFMPASARAENDSRSITQRITELRNRLDSFCGNPAKTEAQSSKTSSYSGSGEIRAASKEPQADSSVKMSISEKNSEKSIDGEKFVLLPADASEYPSANVSPEGESAAIEHSQNVTMTVLFHDADTPAQAGRINSSEPITKNADSTIATEKKP